jgi:hypothetical protein
MLMQSVIHCSNFKSGFVAIKRIVVTVQGDFTNTMIWLIFIHHTGMTVEPHKKQLHVSLAYQFPTDKKEKLEQLARAINLKAPARWDLRLYSRDAQKGRASYQVSSAFYFALLTYFVCRLHIYFRGCNCE